MFGFLLRITQQFASGMNAHTDKLSHRKRAYLGKQEKYEKDWLGKNGGGWEECKNFKKMLRITKQGGEENHKNPLHCEKEMCYNQVVHKMRTIGNKAYEIKRRRGDMS